MNIFKMTFWELGENDMNILFVHDTVTTKAQFNRHIKSALNQVRDHILENPRNSVDWFIKLTFPIMKKFGYEIVTDEDCIMVYTGDFDVGRNFTLLAGKTLSDEIVRRHNEEIEKYLRGRRPSLIVNMSA